MIRIAPSRGVAGLVRLGRGPVALLVLLGLLIAALVPGTASAGSSISTSGQFGITPARRHVTGLPGIFLTPTEVINTTNSSYRVTVFPVLLSQQLTGAFTFSQSPSALAAGRNVLSVTPSNFTLAPDHEMKVTLHWNGMPAASRQADAGIVFQGIRQHQNGQVLVITRLLSVNFLTLPGRLTVSGRFTGLRATQFGKRVLRFLPRVQNTGQRAWAPSGGTFDIRDASGHVVYRTGWLGDVIIPGAQREFPIDVSKVLPAGTYTMTAGMDFPRHQKITEQFTLTGPNRLPSASVNVPSFNASGTIGSPAEVVLKVVNPGTAAGSLAVRVKIAGAAGRALASHFSAAAVVSLPHVSPGFNKTIRRSLGHHLVPGSYQVQATWTDSTGVPHDLVMAFTASPPGSARGWLSRHWALITGIFGGLLLLLVLAVLLRRQRRLQTELAAALAHRVSAEEEPESEHAPEPESVWAVPREL